MPLRAIVFDFDGVLVDSEAAHGAGLAAAAAALGMEIRGERPDWYVGLGDHECFERIARANGRVPDAGLIADLVARKAEAFCRLSREGRISAYPGSFELLRSAAGRVPVAVCSGSHRRDIEPLLERHRASGLLSALVAADDVARTKPDPEPYLLAAKRLGVRPPDCVAIEDSPAGIASAVGAGLRVHAVCHSFPRERLGAAHHVHACIRGCGGALLRDLGG
jgi:beta-phosphoglucomutase